MRNWFSRYQLHGVGQGVIDANRSRLQIRLTPRALALLSGLLLSGILAQYGLTQVGIDVPLVRPVLAVVFLTFVPGAFGYLALGAPDRSLATTLCYVYGLSLASIMGIGGLASLVLPVVGIERVFTLPVLVGIAAALVVALVVTLQSTLTLRVRTATLLSPVTLCLLLFPLASVLGTALYATGGSNFLLLALMASIALVPVLVALSTGGERYFPLAIWSISVSLLYHGRIFGFFTITQPLPNVVMEVGRWVPNYETGVGSLLANGVLYPVYAIFTGLPMAAEWNLVNPFIVAMLPVVLFEAYRRYISATGAFLSTCIFMFSYSYYVLYPTGGRAATPVIFLGLLALATSDTDLPAKTQHLVLLLFGAGVAVTHYGTAYVVMFALLVSGLAFAVLTLLVRLNLPKWLAGNLSSGSAKRALSRAADRTPQFERPAVLRGPYIAFYSSLALAWYLYTGLGGKFSTLPRKVVDGITGVFYGQTSGSTVTSFQQDYSAISITVAKYFYVVFGLLMSLGIAIAVFKLVVDRDEIVSTGQLALGIGFLSMFAGSALPSGEAFAVARVMMIIFTFSVPFAVVGLESLASGVAELLSSLEVGHVTTTARIGLGLFIALFFLLNSGFVAETVTDGYAPSNAASEQRLAESEIPPLRLRVRDCVRCDVQTHIWAGNNVPQSETMYGDVLMGNQLDYYAGTISDQANQERRYQSVNSSMTDLKSGDYIGLLAHNRDLQGFSIGYKFNFYETDLGPYTDGNVLYTNGYAVVAHEPNGTEAPR